MNEFETMQGVDPNALKNLVMFGYAVLAAFVFFVGLGIKKVVCG